MRTKFSVCLLAGAIVASAVAQVTLPDSVKPAKELQGLEFMAGRWISVTPNKLVNEEHWTTPRGKSMVGTFRQIRRDGVNAFTEVSLISVEKDGVRLRLRHLHSQLEVPAERAEPNDFMLKASGRNWVEFFGIGNSKDVVSVIYRLKGANEMEVITSFAPTSKERGYTLRYTRETLAK